MTRGAARSRPVTKGRTLIHDSDEYGLPGLTRADKLAAHLGVVHVC